MLLSCKMALKSILAKKGRSFLTMLGIIIGIASVMTIVSVIAGYNQKTLEHINSMGTNKISVYAQRNDGKNMFPELYDFCIGMSDIVDGITPNMYLWVNGAIKYGSRTSNGMEQPPEMHLGGDQYGVCNNFKIEKGRDINKIDIDKYNKVCVLGSKAARAFFDYVDPVGKELTIAGTPFTVIGVYKEKDPDSPWSADNVIILPYTASRVLNPQASLNEFTVKAKTKDAVSEVVGRLDGFLRAQIPTNNSGWYSVYSENQYIDSESDYANQMSLVLGGIALISLLVGGIGIMNIMLVTVTERTREIGIRRAIGAPRRSIVMQFLVEAAMICGIGGLFGIAVGFGGTLIAGKLIVDMTLLPNLMISLVAFLFSVLLGVIFGLYPAIKASRLLPVVALRAE